MPTENPTLERIQREISEQLLREKEFRSTYRINGSLNNNNEDRTKTPVVNGVSNPYLPRSQSTNALLTTTQPNKNGFRRFVPNPAAKGIMEKFLKSRGKLATASSVNNLSVAKQDAPTLKQSWAIADYIEPPKVPLDSVKHVRRGYIPVQERMRKELQDLHNREQELKLIRMKSQPDFNEVFDELDSEPKHESNLRASKSMAQLFCAEDFEVTNSAPASLKPARSLADLCDASEDDLETPGSNSLILQWENMIQKNQQAST